MIGTKATNPNDFFVMKHLNLEFKYILTLGLLFLTQISFTQDLIVRPNDAASNHIMVEPQNTFFGAFFGYQAGRKNIGCCNTFIGSTTGGLNTTGIENTFLGTGAGEQSVIGNGNTYLGRFAGRLSTGSRNVFVGSGAGYGELGDDLLYIDNGGTTTPLLHGFFAKDSLVINGDLNITGNLIAPSIQVSRLTGVLGNGYSAVAPVVADNTVEIEISSVLSGSDVLVTSSVGFEIDTFTLFGGGTCLNPNVGFSDEFPLTFETDNASDITALNSWYASPSPVSMSMIFKDSGDSETSRINMFEYYPGTTSAGTGGRTSFTLRNGIPPRSNSLVEIDEYLGSSNSFNPATDELVEISGVTHSNFTPAVQVDYGKRVITLEMTYDEGAGLITWINDVSDGVPGQKKAVSIIETNDGVTEISRENFFEVLPFKYEIIYGFGLNTKMVARIQLIYGCNEPG
jgi:hypothetical protein